MWDAWGCSALGPQRRGVAPREGFLEAVFSVVLIPRPTYRSGHR